MTIKKDELSDVDHSKISLAESSYVFRNHFVNPYNVNNTLDYSSLPNHPNKSVNLLAYYPRWSTVDSAVQRYGANGYPLKCRTSQTTPVAVVPRKKTA